MVEMEWYGTEINVWSKNVADCEGKRKEKNRTIVGLTPPLQKQNKKQTTFLFCFFPFSSVLILLFLFLLYSVITNILAKPSSKFHLVLFYFVCHTKNNNVDLEQTFIIFFPNFKKGGKKEEI